MQYKENIPSELQIKYNCDYLVWDSQGGSYIGIQGTFPVCTLPLEEVQCDLQALQDYYEWLAEEDYEYQLQLYEDMVWMNKVC